MDNDYLSLIGVLLGGFIGFTSAYWFEKNRQRDKKEEHEKRIKRLAVLLYEEIEQAAELLEIDLETHLSTTPKEIVLEEGLFLFSRWEAAIERIRQCRIIFDAHANELIDLPDSLPNQLVRFHNQLQTHCNKMLAAINKEELLVMDHIRKQALKEAENAKHNLRRFIKTSKKN